MDIAFFTESYVPMRDGVAVEVHSLARTLHRLGHRVTVYAPHPVSGAPADEVRVDGVPVVRVRSVPVPLYTQYRWSVFPFRSFLNRRFGRDTDVIHVHTPGMMGSGGFLAARHFRKPLLGTFHTNVWEMRNSFPRKALVRLFFRTARWYSSGVYHRCDLTTVPSLPARDALLEHASKPFRRPIEVVPNGIEVQRYHPGISTPDWRERCGLPDVPLLTYLGRLTADKGIHRFLDTVRALAPEYRFAAVVAGVGPEEPQVRQRLRSDPLLRERVRYVGPIAEDEKGALLAQSDVFLLPSTSDTSSIALLEAMACGAACVASDIGGPRDIVRDHETGRLVSIHEPGALARAVGDLLEHPEERRRLSGEATRFVRQEASIEGTARRFISLYEQLLSEIPGRAAGESG
jgi:glycosyltransferase involved in cell wall biosynthesis